MIFKMTKLLFRRYTCLYYHMETDIDRVTGISEQLHGMNTVLEDFIVFKILAAPVKVEYLKPTITGMNKLCEKHVKWEEFSGRLTE